MLPQLVIVNPNDYRKVCILGDLHGDNRALGALLGTVDLEGDLLVFLGDYADRGPYGVEVIQKVRELQENYLKNVVALKGNHEDYSETGVPNFSPCTLINEAEAKLGSWDRYFREELKPFIDALPLCLLIPNNVLLVHGGISTRITGIEDLQLPSVELRMDLLWSDPKDGDGEDPNWMRGAGVEFGADVSSAVCRALGVGRVIRSHQPQLAATGPYCTHDGRVVTVNATSVYGGVPFVYCIDPKSTKSDYFTLPS